jgi:hypothetical protein
MRLVQAEKRYVSYSSLWLYRRLKLGRFFGFLALYRVGRPLWAGDQPVARPLSTQRISTPSSTNTILNHTLVLLCFLNSDAPM